ncbi:MAG: Na+/H+ antiporter subunit E [Clostridia bacterium]|nr:Na+/H+ antiporter subunit E [Clostridia bacterium]
MAVLTYGFWVVLNGKITWEIMLLGLPVAALAMFFVCACCDWSLKKEGRLYRCVPQLIVYAGVVIWEIIKANLVLGRTVYRGRPRPVVRTVETGLKSRFARMVLANSITLTPGTITLSLKGNHLTVHCLTPEMAEGLDCTVFEKRLKKMEELLHG